MVVAIVVMFLAAVPFTEVRLGEMSYVRPQLDCAVEQRIARGAEPAEVNGLATGTAYDAPLGTISGEVGRIPIWWGFVHVVSKAVVAAGTAAIPCTGDVVRLTMTLGNDTVEDPLLLKELADFTTDCHRPAVRRMYTGAGGGGSFTALSQMDYVGSGFFLDTPGYYDGLYSRRDRPAFPPNPVRDAGLEGSHPTCREWWRDGANGLRARLLAEIDTPHARRDGLRPERDSPRGEPRDVGRGAGGPAAAPLPSRTVPGTASGVSSVSYEPGVAENYRMGAAAHDRALTGVVHATGDVIDDVLSMGAAGLGMLLQGPGNVAAGVAIREGMPIFLALLLMVFVAVLPVLMVFSRYDVSVLVTLTLVFFGLQFFHVLWGMAFWVDNHLYEALSGPAGAPKANPIQGLVSLWVQRFLYIVFPMIWLAAIGWVGVKAESAMGGISKLADSSAGAAQSGGDTRGGRGEGRRHEGAGPVSRVRGGSDLAVAPRQAAVFRPQAALRVLGLAARAPRRARR